MLMYYSLSNLCFDVFRLFCAWKRKFPNSSDYNASRKWYSRYDHAWSMNIIWLRWRSSALMLDSEVRSPANSEFHRGWCVEFLGRTLQSQSVSLFTWEYNMIPAEWKGRGSLFYFEGGATTNLVEGKEASLCWVAWNRISLGRIKWNPITGWFIVHCHSFSSKARPDQVRWHIHRNTWAIARNLGRRKEKTVICFWGTCCKHRENREKTQPIRIQGSRCELQR